MVETVARKESFALKDLCKGHLKAHIIETDSLDKKLHGGHLYYLAHAERCLNESIECTSNIEDVDDMKCSCIDYLVFLKGALTNDKLVWNKLVKVIKKVRELKTTHELRVGYETILLLAKQMRKVTESSGLIKRGTENTTKIETPGCILKDNEDLLVETLNSIMSNSHFVIRNIIKNIVKELVGGCLESSLLNNVNWSVHNRTSITLSMKSVRLSASEGDIFLLNDKKSGDKITKLLLLADHMQYAKMLQEVDFTSVGARNIRILSSKLSNAIRREIFAILVEHGSLNCVFFTDACSVIPEDMHEKCIGTKNENVRVEYFESLLKDQATIESRLGKIVRWLQYNQILMANENQKRVRLLFYTVVKAMRYKVVTKYKYLVENQLEDNKNQKSMVLFKEIIEIVLGMAESTNYCRVLQGLHYLKVLIETKDVQDHVPEKRFKEIILNALTETHKEVREISASFKMDITAKQIDSAVKSTQNSELHGMALLLADNITEKNRDVIQQIMKNALERIQNAQDLSNVHKDIHVLWSVFNALPADRIFLEGNRINPAHIVETKKRKSFGMPGLNILETYKIDLAYDISDIYNEFILPLFRKSLKILQTREIYLSEHTEVLHTSKERDEETTSYLLSWYAIRECIMFIAVHAITTNNVQCLDILTDALLTVGGHLGVIMIASDVIKSILLFCDAPETTLNYAKDLMNLITTKDLKNIRRDGGIPYAFKALSASEGNSKSKIATHYVMKEALQRSFMLIENRFVFKPVRDNFELTFSSDCGISQLQMEKDVSSVEPKIENEKYLIHYLNVLKSISSDGIFKYDMRVYEPSLFLLSAMLISHSNWKVRNTSLMLYTTLIKKMCKETLNTLEDARYSKISVNSTSKKVLCDCLEYFTAQNDKNGIFSCIVFFLRINLIDERERGLLSKIRATSSCKRTCKKIDQILHKTAEPANDIIISAHTVIPRDVENILAMLVSNEDENAVGVYNTGKKCAGIDSGCMKLESEILNILGSEDEYIRDYVVNKYMPNSSYEYALHALVYRARCKVCLKARIDSSMAQMQCILGSEQFPSERLNMFRDFSYELSLLQRAL
ncbi:hypothetical protein NEPAR06_1229 [Nematocida parisii]|nr:hypothetical protein NEPAR06_1229 [Nematocida parisii]KAI5157585.1 hypothetical protein NEPAR05_1408 [Nematocida parisii]